MRVLSHRKPLPPKGAALLVVLLVVSLISGLVISVLTVMNHYAIGEAENSHTIEAYILAQKGLSYGSHPLISRDDPLLNYESEDGASSYHVEISSEASRLDINQVLLAKDKEILRRLFTSWGLDLDSAAALVDAMVDWVDANDIEELNGAEQSYYVSQGFANRPYNKVFSKVTDIQLVKGFSKIRQLKPDWERFFTVWSGEKLDIYESDIELLMAATSKDRESLEQFRLQTLGEDGIAGTKDDLRHSSLNEALVDLNIAGEEGIGDILEARLQLNSNTKRVKSVASVSGTYKQITVIIRHRGNQLELIHHNEKITDKTSGEN